MNTDHLKTNEDHQNRDKSHKMEYKSLFSVDEVVILCIG